MCPSGCRLPGKARPSQRAGGQEKVLADPVCGRVLSQQKHRPQRPEGGEPAAGWPHEHQDCRYFKLSVVVRYRWVCFLNLRTVLETQKCLSYLPKSFEQCWEVVRVSCEMSVGWKMLYYIRIQKLVLLIADQLYLTPSKCVKQLCLHLKLLKCCPKNVLLIYSFTKKKLNMHSGSFQAFVSGKLDKHRLQLMSTKFSFSHN